MNSGMHDLCTEGLCTRDAECLVEIPESEQTVALCREHGKAFEARAERIKLTIQVRWLERFSKAAAHLDDMPPGGRGSTR